MTPSLITLRQSAAVLLAHSVCALFPRTSILQLKATGSGFSCDFRLGQKLDVKALSLIEEKIRTTIFEDVSFKTMEMMRENGVSLLEHHKFPDLARELKGSCGNIATIVQFDNIYVPIEGVVSSSKEVGFVKLLAFSETDGIIRITGAVYPNQQKLKQFLKQWEKYQKVNHKKLGEELDLFFEAGGWNWQPSGTRLLEVLIDWWKQEHRQQGFSPIRGSPYQIFKKEGSTTAKYCQLRVMEGELSSSLFENAPFTKDESYIYCLPEQLPHELTSSLHFFKKTSIIFGFETEWHLVVSEGNKKKFDPLIEALEKENINYTVEKRHDKSVAPAIEGRVVDLLGREWPLFSLSYEGLKQSLITRELFGSIERVTALLVEKHAGQFPLWLAPEQVRVIPVKSAHAEYAQKVREKLVESGYRVGYDLSEDKMSSKIHSAIRSCVPYMLIVGEEEIKKDRVAVRSRNNEESPRSVTLQEFLAELGTIIRREEAFES